MDILQKQLNNDIEPNIPANLHRKLVLDLFFNKFKTPMLLILSAAIINFGWLVFRLYSNLIDTSAMDVINQIWQGFDWDTDYLWSALLSLKEILPLIDVIYIGLNALLIVLLGYLLRKSSWRRFNKGLKIEY